MRQMPFSLSETSLDLFFNPAPGALSDYAVWQAPGAGVELQQTWCDVRAIWSRGRAGKCLLRLTRRMPREGIDTRGNDQLRLFCAVAGNARMDVVINGKRYPVKSGLEGAAQTFPLKTTRLKSISFELFSTTAGEGGVSFVWTALVNSCRDRDRLKPQGRYDSDWAGLMIPETQRLSPGPELELLFGRNDVEVLRQKARSPLYRRWMDDLRTRAHEFMTAEPEALIGRFACPPLHYTRPLERNSLAGTGGYGKSWDNFHHLALAGLLDRDPRMIRHAARWLLSVAHCEYWYNDFEGEIPGVTWHHRAFTESEVSLQSALALDWAGCALTPTGKGIVLDAISRRGLPRIQHEFIDPQMEYIRSCNQGPWFNAGRIMGLLALAKSWPRAKVRLPEVLDDMREMFEKVYSIDGGSVEGPAYWRVTTSYGLLGAIALARYQGCAVMDLVPEKIRNLALYPAGVMSLARPGCSLPMGDSRGDEVCPFSVAVMIQKAFPTPAARRLTGYMLSLSRKSARGKRFHFEGNSDPAWSLLFGPSRISKVDSIIPECGLLPGSGHAVLCRSRKGVGHIRFQILGAPRHHASHSHEDRGSILLEAGDEEILVDRGIGHYSNPLGNQVKQSIAHNLLVPDGMDGTPLSQTLWTERNVIPALRYEKGRFRVRMDLREVWGPTVKQAWRTVESDTPGEFILTDDIIRTKKGGAVLHFHTPCSIQPVGAKWILRGPRVQVEIEPLWTPAEATQAEEDFGMGSYGRAYAHLQLRVTASLRHRLVTRIKVV